MDPIDILQQNTSYLIQIIKNLIELNNYPDIRINYYFQEFGYNTRVRAELITCTGEMIVVEQVIDTHIFEHEDYKEYIEDSLLKEIAYKFIKRAYDERKSGNVQARASDFYRSCQKIGESST